MQKGPIYYPEYELVEKHQNGEFNWVDYIRQHSEGWCEEYEAFCKEHGYDEDNDDAAREFVDNKNGELENAVAEGNA